MKIVILLDSCINCDRFCNVRIKQYENGLKSILKHYYFFKDNNIDIIFVDNSIDNLNDYPTIKNLLFEDIKIITKNFNDYGKKNPSAGVFEHWLISKDVWKNYDYLIHYEIRQVLTNINFFEEFIKEPISMFGWCTKIPYKNKKWKDLFPPGLYTNKDPKFEIEKYGRDNSNVRSIMFNDFYTGLMSIKIKEFLPFVENYDLDSIIIPDSNGRRKSLENIILCFSYDFLPKFKIVERLYLKRYSLYNSLKKIEEY